MVPWYKWISYFKSQRLEKRRIDQVQNLVHRTRYNICFFWHWKPPKSPDSTSHINSSAGWPDDTTITRQKWGLGVLWTIILKKSLDSGFLLFSFLKIEDRRHKETNGEFNPHSFSYSSGLVLMKLRLNHKNLGLCATLNKD